MTARSAIGEWGIETKGGKTVQPVTEIPNGPTIALFADPASNTIGLRKR